MPDFRLDILGANSAVPSLGRYPTAQLLTWDSGTLLIDCGEGTQIRLLEYGLKSSKIDYICISHLHGDHCFGLPGLLNSLILSGREKPLKIYGPKGIINFLEATIHLRQIENRFDLDIFEQDHETSTILFEDSTVVVSSFPLVHRIPTIGFKIEEKKPSIKYNKEKVKGLSVDQMKKLANGNDIIDDTGTLVPKGVFIKDILPPTSYAFCSDTIYNPQLVQYIKGVTVLYHESTFLNEMEEEAAKRYHSTAKQAALIADEAQVKVLVLGHFSNRYRNVIPFIEEASQVFSNVFVAETGKSFQFNGFGLESEKNLSKITD